VLFENPGWPNRNWITLQLEGTTANRSAIGARVQVVVADSGGKDRTLYRTVGTGGSFGSNALELHIGLGTASAVKEVRVAWPDRVHSTTSYTNLAVRQTYRITQGKTSVLLARSAVAYR
jgi:hypothetical protein